MAKQKKRGTGMSQRVSFLDRSVIEENKAILRYNDDLERAARREDAIRRGETPPADPPPDRPRRTGPQRDAPSGGGRPREGGPARPPRPPRPPREPRPGEPELLAAAQGAEGWTAYAQPGRRLVEHLLRGRKPGRANALAWKDISDAQPPDADWDVVRASWATVTDAVLAVWYQLHPDEAPPPPKKRKPWPRKRPKKKPGEGEGEATAAGAAVTPAMLAGLAHLPGPGQSTAPEAAPTENRVDSSADSPQEPTQVPEETAAEPATQVADEPVPEPPGADIPPPEPELAPNPPAADPAS
jgi:hypothetical protein